MKLIIINGPNLNLLGKREKNVYGDISFEQYFETIVSKYKHINISYFQSNHEGNIIDKLHEVGYAVDGIIFNPGALTHTSIAIADAIASITSPVIEVHISNIHARETFRHHSYVSKHAKGILIGFGLKGYELAINSFLV